MDCKVTSTKGAAAESLASTLIGLGLACLLSMALAAVYLYCTRSFADLGNYVDMDSKARLALDVMSREIRQADNLTLYSSNSVTFQAGSNQLSYTLDTAKKTLTRRFGTANTTLLTDCDDVRFNIFQRNPINGAYDYYPAADPANCKVVQVTLLCSRSLLGHKAESANAQSARIVIRKQR
jgi:hypothetical protein